MSEFFYRSGSNEFGPLTRVQLKKLVQGGRVGGNAKFRRGRSGKWLPTAELPALLDQAVRTWEQAINEMDIVAEPACPAALAAQPTTDANRDTACDGDSTGDYAVFARQGPPVSDAQSGTGKPHQVRTTWARVLANANSLVAGTSAAVGAICILRAENAMLVTLGVACLLNAACCLASSRVILSLLRVLVRQPD